MDSQIHPNPLPFGRSARRSTSINFRIRVVFLAAVSELNKYPSRNSQASGIQNDLNQHFEMHRNFCLRSFMLSKYRRLPGYSQDIWRELRIFLTLLSCPLEVYQRMNVLGCLFEIIRFQLKWAVEASFIKATYSGSRQKQIMKLISYNNK